MVDLAQQRVQHPNSYLTDEQKTLVGVWLDTHWTDFSCPFHQGETTWNLGDLIGSVPAHAPTGSVAPAKVYPSIVLVCNICGFTVLINALKVGVVPRDEPAPASQPVSEAESSAEGGA